MPIVLPPDIEKALVAAKKQFDEAEYELNRAEKAGLDVTYQRQVVAQAKQHRDQILATYGRAASQVK